MSDLDQAASRTHSTARDFRELVSEIVRRSLDAGQAVEIEGLGTFQASRRNGASGESSSGRYVFTPSRSAQVFIAYAAEDLTVVRKLCEELKIHGCSPWLDKDQLLPGQNWPRAIERAIDVADAFVACFSPRSVAKPGQFQCELRYALDCARRRPFEETFVIPVRLEECAVPRRLADHVQYVDLFPDWKAGIRRIVRAARKTTHRKSLLNLKPSE